MYSFRALSGIATEIKHVFSRQWTYLRVQIN